MTVDDAPSGACLIGQIAIRDPDKWVRYRDGVSTTLWPFDATVVARGERHAVLVGAPHGTDMVVIRFPDVESIERWYRSPAYQALIPLRDEAADVVITSYQVTV